MTLNLKSEEILLRNNTSNKSKENLIESFAIRIKEFQSVFLALKNSSLSKVAEHFLIAGQRGAGKTTLLHRLKYAIDDDPELSEKLVPIIFTEEQYQLSELSNLWESVGGHMEDFRGWNNAASEMENIYFSDPQPQRALFNYLEKRALENGIRITLFIENVNVFLRKIGNTEVEQLVDILKTSKAIQLITSTTSFYDGYINFNAPIFNFFKVISLGGLSREESEALLLKISEAYGEELQIKNIIINHPGRIESLRRLTGGVPRTISYLFQIFLDNENGKAIKDLYILIDTLTFLYKAELDQLSPQQQKVIDVIARKWDAISVKEIVKYTRFESKNISSILSALEKNQFIEIVKTSNKNNLYRIKERFMNIWYLMRYGRKHDRDSIIWLVRFFDAWCDETELAKRINSYLRDLGEGQYDTKAALYMGNAFLSCENVPEILKLQLFKATKSKLPGKLQEELILSSKHLDNTFQKLVEDKNYDQALAMLAEINLKDVHYYNVAYNLYFLVGKHSQSAEAAKKVVELDSKDNKAALRLGIIYEEYLNDIELAIEWLKISLSRTPSQIYAAMRLGDIYAKVVNEPTLAEFYYRLALKRGFKKARINLAKLFIKLKKYVEAEEILLEAVDNQTPGAFTELAQVFVHLQNNKKIKYYLEKAIHANETEAKVNMSRWYLQKTRRNVKKAEEFLRSAIEDGDLAAYSELAELYDIELQNDELALKAYEEGINKGDAESAHQLAHFYSVRKQFDKSDEMFAKSIEMGDKFSPICWLTEIYVRGRKDKKQFALELMEKHLNELNERYKVTLFYARLLLWNDKIKESVDVVESAIANMNLQTDNAYKMAESRIKNTITQLSNYFMLLLAKGEFQLCLQLFEKHRLINFKTLMKPIYFVLMENMQSEFPLEYLKAGDEFNETIAEIKSRIKKLKENV